MPYQIPISGRLIDSFGSGVSGASVFFTSKATSRGTENVAKTASASFTADASGYYSASVASGWYKIYYQEPESAEPIQIGVATVSGYGGTDLGTLIDNSIPPPSLLENISNVNVTGRVDGSSLQWNAATRRWDATPSRAAGVIYQTTTPTANVGGAFTNLSSYAVPANTLNRDGDSLRVTSVFTTTGSYALTQEKRIRATFGGATVYDVSAFNAYNNFARPVNIVAQLFITRTGANGQNAYSITQHDEYSAAPFFNEPMATGLSLNLAASQTLRFSVSGLNSADIVQREITVEFVPAP